MGVRESGDLKSKSRCHPRSVLRSCEGKEDGDFSVEGSGRGKRTDRDIIRELCIPICLRHKVTKKGIRLPDLLPSWLFSFNVSKSLRMVWEFSNRD